jgi:MerR family transcriptional regulator, redox-sensitive transcriptional activator SoxR
MAVLHPQPQLTIGEVAARAGMRASRIRYYEARGLLPEPERSSGQRRYTEEALRRLAIVDAAQRIGFTLDEIADLLGTQEGAARERLRALAELKLPEIEALIDRATTVRALLERCVECDCESLDVCSLFGDEAALATPVAPAGPGAAHAAGLSIRKVA